MRIDRRSFVRRTAWAGVSALGFLDRRSDRSQAEEAKSSVSDSHSQSENGRVRVRVWCEGTARRSVYPDDIDGALAAHLGRRADLAVERARLTEPAAGLSNKALDATDVLVWWGRLRHDAVPADRARAVVERVKAGRLGFVALHGACASKPFRSLMGTSCEPGGWREDGRPEHVRIQSPEHPIARGVGPFVIPRADMFAEPFHVPTPETVVLVSTWEKGETMRSGLTWTIGQGRVVYLRPGHDAFPILFHPSVRQVIANAVLWTARRV
jgi:trehalose utilization protein